MFQKETVADSQWEWQQVRYDVAREMEADPPESPRRV